MGICGSIFSIWHNTQVKKENSLDLSLLFREKILPTDADAAPVQFSTVSLALLSAIISAIDSSIYVVVVVGRGQWIHCKVISFFFFSLDPVVGPSKSRPLFLKKLFFRKVPKAS